MSIIGIDHYGVLVRDIEHHYNEHFSHLLSNGYGEIFVDPLQEAKVAFVALEGGRIELVQPTNPDSRMAKELKKRAGIWHHVCLTTDDLELQLAQCKSNGQFVISEPKPAVAFQGRRIAFVMGRDQLLWELLESSSV